MRLSFHSPSLSFSLKNWTFPVPLFVLSSDPSLSPLHFFSLSCSSFIFSPSFSILPVWVDGNHLSNSGFQRIHSTLCKRMILFSEGRFSHLTLALLGDWMSWRGNGSAPPSLGICPLTNLRNVSKEPVNFSSFLLLLFKLLLLVCTSRWFQVSDFFLDSSYSFSVLTIFHPLPPTNLFALHGIFLHSYHLSWWERTNFSHLPAHGIVVWLRFHDQIYVPFLLFLLPCLPLFRWFFLLHSSFIHPLSLSRSTYNCSQPLEWMMTVTIFPLRSFCNLHISFPLVSSLFPPNSCNHFSFWMR